MSSEIKTNTISEVTSANGVTIDGVNIKDSKINTGAIGNSVTVEGSFGVTDRSSLFNASTDATLDIKKAYSFNGFMFINVSGSHSSPANDDPIFQISNSDFYPTVATTFPSISYQGDYVWNFELKTNGECKMTSPVLSGDAALYFTINGFYRYL